MKLSSQRGVALVITLIFLAIITFLAVAFLATARRDKSSMSATQNQTGSKLMADQALARAQAEILGKMMARSNLLGVEMMVSRNYINPAGFNTGQPAGQVDTNNVNYDYTQGGAALNQNQFIQNVANLFFDPRPPVFVKTSKAGPLDFRFYHDLNRNGRFDTNGFRRALDRNGNSMTNGSGGFLTNFFKGDPEWIGVLARPEFPHSSSNQFVGRYSYLVLPTGLTLDVNHLHNQSKQLGPGVDGFLRNQGVGSWELNLAAFLRDLNTNNWNYSYDTNLGASSISGGLGYDAFDDAKSILTNRYNGTYANLNSFNQLFTAAAATAFRTDGIDGYGDGPLMDTARALGLPEVPEDTSRRWSGSDSPKKVMNIEDLLVSSKTPAGFVAHLGQTMTNRSTYDQSTFYRLIEQLGTESTAELQGKMNLNYTNNLLLNTADTNFVSWTPIGFFTNAADLLLRSYTNFSIANIQIFPTNQYTPAVHRLLQLAANIYDSSTNRGLAYPYFPSVFRPIFRRDNNNAVFISGYVEALDATFLNNRFYDLVTVASNAFGNLDKINIYGVPCVIGAKKGLPNFNEYSLQTGVRVTRKLQFLKLANASTPYRTNQMYIFSITNFLGVEAWNSYTQAFPRAVQIIATNFATIRLTNENGVIPVSINPPLLQPGNRYTLGANTWKGFDGTEPPGNFQIPISTYVPILPTARYRPDRPPSQIFDTNLVFDATATGFPIPNIGMVVSNRLVFAIVDTSVTPNRVLDMVSLGDIRVGFNLNEELNRPTPLFGGGVSSSLNRMWRTNRVNGSASINAPTEGIATQIDVGLNNQSVTFSEWRSFNAQVNDKDASVAAFRSQLSTNTPYATNFYSPFEPTVVFVKSFGLQANDPLVHYTVKDLTDPRTTNLTDFINPPNQPATYNIFTNISGVSYNIGTLNTRYSPWINPLKGVDPEIGFDPAFKDPLIYNSDNWDFPTNKFPGVGWLGRVHRGTPWQTVYLKSAIANPQKWVNSWVGTLETHPTNDWKLMDLFTVAPNDNAARGLLSVNQPGQSAWAAGLGGVLVLSNSVANGAISPRGDQYTALPIEPASTALATIVDGVNKYRAKLGPKTFRSVGEILAVPELTIKSPLLNPTGDQPRYGISDAAYERIPQQVMSLLKLGDPRFVVYSYGQSLKPLNVHLGAQYFNMVTNYQITGEVATKTVLRVQGGPNGQYDARNPRVVIESFTVLPAE